MSWKNFLLEKRNIAILIIIVILVHFPISFLIYSVKWDSLSVCLPWRFMVGEAIRNNYLPWWNPYQNLGYPLHADMQITPWYLPVWLFSLFKPYTLLFVQYEYLFHIIIGGIGMYWFTNSLKTDKTVCLIVALSYSLCGLMVSDTQHQHHIAAAAWLPYTIGSFYHLLRKPGILNILKLSFFGWLIFTGGYTGIVIVLVYLLSIWCILFIVFHWAIKKNFRFKVLIACFVSLFLIILFSLPQFISLIQLMPYSTRQYGLTLEWVQFGAFTPKSFYSFILPYGTVKNFNWLGTDISLANIYFGICTLCLAFLGIFHPSPYKWAMLLTIVISLIIALGSYTPVSEFLFYHVPLMNMSRFPALYRVFITISFLLLAVLGWKLMSRDFMKFKKIIITIILLVLSIIIVIFFLNINSVKFNFIEFLSKAAFKDSALYNNEQHLLFQSVIQMLFLILWGIMTFLIKNFKLWKKLTIFLMIIDLSVSVNLNTPYTTYDANGPKFEKVNDAKKNFFYGFNKSHKYLVSETDSLDKMLFTPPIYVNVSNFSKRVSTSGFSSFFINDYENIRDTKKEYLDSITKNKVFFLTQDVRKMELFSDDIRKLNFSKNTIYVDEINQEIKKDSSFKSFVDNIRLSPSSFSVDIQTNSTAFLMILQNYYPYWKAYIDGKEARLIKVNNTFMGVYVGKGARKVILIYDNFMVKIAYYISMISLLSAAIIFFTYRYKKSKRLNQIQQ
jgi:hypothetical protein